MRMYGKTDAESLPSSTSALDEGRSVTASDVYYIEKAYGRVKCHIPCINHSPRNRWTPPPR